MAEYNKYAALANTIKLEDITPNKQNQTILQKLINNDEYFDKFYIASQASGDPDDYVPGHGEDIGWLGYFIGNNTNLHKLAFYATINDESFHKETSCNTSIQTVEFCDHSLLNGRMFMMMVPLFKNNHNLTGFETDGCTITAEGIRQLSIALGGCGRSLKHIKIANLNDDITYIPLVEIITALSMHPQLKDLDLSGTSIGRNECAALSTLLRSTTTQLQTLDLADNNIDDDGLESLVNGLVHLNQLRQLTLTRNQLITSSGWKIFSTLLEMPSSNLEVQVYLANNRIDNEGIQSLINGIVNANKLQELHIGSNPAITSQGWRAVSTLLEMPQSNLKRLHVHYNNIKDEEGLLFAKALAKNSTLETLGLSGSRITSEGWAPFSKLLCDTSTINNTYLSNHTLQSFGPPLYDSSIPDIIESYLTLNYLNNKDQVAVWKILIYHSHFDMEPFFEWEFRVLPLMVDWFVKATATAMGSPGMFGHYSQKIKKMKLSVIYDFIKEFPMLYIEPMTRKEIAEYTAMEEELLWENQMGGEQEVRLNEIQQLKAKAMRRVGMK